MKNIGLDTHSTTTVATVLSDHGRKILQRRIPTREFDLIDFMRSISGPKRVALEENQLADFVTRVIAPYTTEVSQLAIQRILARPFGVKKQPRVIR